MTRLARPVRLTAFAVVLLVLAAAQPWRLIAQAPAPSTGVRFATIAEADVREYLTTLSSDLMMGRQSFTEGYGVAAAYVAKQLEAWGVKPIGDAGSYYQIVKRRGYRVVNNSSVTLQVAGVSRTFKHGEHVTFPALSGGRQTLTFKSVEFAGYGQVNLGRNYDDFRGRSIRGQFVTYMPGMPNALVDPQGRGGRGGGGNRGPFILETYGAAGVVSFAAAPEPPSAELLAAQAELDRATAVLADAQAKVAAARGRGGAGRGGAGAGRAGGGRGAGAPADLTTVLDVAALRPPSFMADLDFYTLLFSGLPGGFAGLRAKATAGEPLEPMTIPNVTLTINIDASYELLTSEMSRNVVGLVEGSDPTLRSTYVMFGAHLDHTGYNTNVAAAGRGGPGAAAPAGEPDVINNGADDDGSGSAGLLGVAKAFATGTKPRRSVVFVWHTAEESGLLGSRYNADFPVVPLDRVQAVFNADMIGRNRDDDPALSRSVFVIGADRISTDLHNLLEDTNGTLARPLTLDYEYNDPSDTNSFYTRSDHYSYAAKGIPIAFFFTGTHADYHRASDHVEKILFPKLADIAQLMYQAGFNVANSDRTLTRDNRGPRAGRGFKGRIQ